MVKTTVMPRRNKRAAFMRPSLAPFLGMFGLLVLTNGCATVAPYERETLAREDMQLSRTPDLTAGTQHATAYREGSAGATGAAGGGCGCN